jgi:hypothetical protein
VDLRRRREGFGRECKKLFDAGVELRGDGEESVIARAGLGGHAVGDFALDHDDGAIDGAMSGEQVEQYVGSDVVGEIAYYLDSGKPLGCLARARLCVRLASLCQQSQICRQNVLVQDGDVGLSGEIGVEIGGEGRVEFDGDDALGAAGEDVRDGSAAGADFDDGAVGDIAERVGDGGLSGRTDEKVLAEFGSISKSHGSPPNLFKPPRSEIRDGGGCKYSVERLFRKRVGRWSVRDICTDCDV